MLGMMNSPNDGVDFYSEPESGMPIFDKKVDKPKVSYMKDGRKLLNGELELTHSPEIMWNSLITRSVAQKIHSSNISCINEPTEGQGRCFLKHWQIYFFNANKQTQICMARRELAI
uniref:Secreted protein n=1 Tax=Parascaris univalens TaxID=6257 RepID=A0A915C0C2_PARUN